MGIVEWFCCVLCCTAMYIWLLAKNKYFKNIVFMLLHNSLYLFFPSFSFIPMYQVDYVIKTNDEFLKL